VPRRCSICLHPARAAIDAALAGGAAFPQVAAEWCVSTHAVGRHYRSGHIQKKIAKSAAAVEIVEADNVLLQARDLQARALTILDQAEVAGELRTAISAIREARGCLELLARLLGEIDDRPQLNLFINPQWTAAMQVVMVALQPYPEARIAVADRLAEVES